MSSASQHGANASAQQMEQKRAVSRAWYTRCRTKGGGKGTQSFLASASPLPGGRDFIAVLCFPSCFKARCVYKPPHLALRPLTAAMAGLFPPVCSGD